MLEFKASMTAVLNKGIVDENVKNTSSDIPQKLPIRLRLFYLSQRLRAHGLRIFDALQAGFWLGILNSDQINAVVSNLYEESNLYRTAAHNLNGFFPYESELIRDHFNGCRSVVVAAAGGGREMIALARAGVRVDGFECNPGLVEKCKEFLAEAGVSGRILYSLPDQVPSQLQQYDGGIVGYGALAHMSGRTKRVNFLRAMKDHLRPQAPLLLSVGRRPEGSRYHIWLCRFARAIRLLRGSTEPVEPGDDLLNCFTHRFLESEMRAELEEAGFKVLAYIETHDMFVVAQA